ncbi:hypothetical protein B5G50_17535 [Brevibacillus brevis]|nr:hypothetical protein B5G50_17535 [Brevibacillus brevis]
MAWDFGQKLSESLKGSRYHVEQARWLENVTKIVCSTALTEMDWTNSKVIDLLNQKHLIQLVLTYERVKRDADSRR